MSRLVVVSNRVAPIQEGEATAGGLAAGVLDALRQKGGLWLGWSGNIRDVPEQQPEHAVGAISLFTIDLSRQDYDQYLPRLRQWHVVAGAALSDRSRPVRVAGYEGYRRVNAMFAQALAKLVRPDDLVWVHDYQLLYVAEAARDAGLTNRIGLFLHTPFPAPGVFMTIPAHADLFRAVCRYDLLGFQTELDRAAFIDYAVRHAGGSVRGDMVSIYDRVLRTGVYPIGVHVDEVRASAELPRNRRQATRIRAALLDRLILSVDRLDYSKGLPQRFAAFERFLAEYPAHHGVVTFMQIAPPSRSDIETYQVIRRQLEGETGRINGRFAEVDWVPLRYLNKSFERNVLMPLYAAAQACLVTPLRDGMNLVAKEFVAAQDPDDPGVLILSEFAGAARELTDALLINPYDEAGVAAAMNRALLMDLEERRERHQAMLAVMRKNSLERWRDRFEADLRG